jgi:hypothetical protein
MCLLVVACAKSKKEEQAGISGGGETKQELGPDGKPVSNSRDGNRTKPKFDITKEGYTSKMLVLEKRAEGSTDNKGTIEVSGKDAMELWERMRVKATSADGVGEAERFETDRKDGKNLSCFEYTPTTEKENTPKYKCVIKFNHSTGKVTQITNVTIDEKIVEKDTDYKGEGGLLTITPSKNDAAALLSLNNDDSKALFDSLVGDAKPVISSTGKDLNDSWNDNKVKLAENIRCYETKNPKKDAAPTYTCSLSINANDGTVKASDTSTAAAATPEDDGKKDDEQSGEPATPDVATSLSSVQASQK